MNVLYKLACRIRRAYLERGFAHYGGGGFIEFSATLVNRHRISIGKHPVIRNRAWIIVLQRSEQGQNGWGRITIGDNVHIARDAIISSAYQVTIGNGVTLGPRVTVLDNNHGVLDTEQSVMTQPLTGGPIVVGDYAWLCANVVILPGVTIGKAAVIGAGSVVNNSIPDYAIAVGNPARVIGSRKPKA